MDTQFDIVVVEESSVTLVQARNMLQLQIACFAGQVTEEELEEDFDRPQVARVLAYHQSELIACAEVFERDVDYLGKIIKVGGFAPCTKAEYRNQGVGTRVCKAAMRYLRAQQCDMLFLSVDTNRSSHPLYERLGFNMLKKAFIYANPRGDVKESLGGMIAPLCSPEVYERVLQGEAKFSLLPEAGYW